MVITLFLCFVSYGEIIYLMKFCFFWIDNIHNWDFKWHRYLFMNFIGKVVKIAKKFYLKLAVQKHIFISVSVAAKQRKGICEPLKTSIEANCD